MMRCHSIGSAGVFKGFVWRVGHNKHRSLGLSPMASARAQENIVAECPAAPTALRGKPSRPVASDQRHASIPAVAEFGLDQSVFVGQTKQIDWEER